MFQFIRNVVKSVATEVLRFAISAGWTFLVKMSVFFDANKRQALLDLAVTRKNVEAIKLLIQNGADVNAAPTEGDFQGQTFLWFAVSINDFTLAKLLIENGANVNIIATIDNNHYFKETSPLCQTVARGNFELAKLLIENGADISVFNKKPLAIATENGYRECATFIKNAQEVKPILTMLALQKQNAANPAFKNIPKEIFMELGTMLTGHKVTKPEAKKLKAKFN